MKSPFRCLVELFQERFLESDSVSAGASFETNISQVLGFLALPGLFSGIYSMAGFVHFSALEAGPFLDWTLRLNRLFFPAYTFAVVGFATFFEWDMLFPDRRDFLILAPFPISLRHLFGAKVVALLLFLLALIAAVNVFPIVLVLVFCSAMHQVRLDGAVCLILGQIAAAACASAFAFFSVAALQGIVVNVVSPKVFQKICPWVQMFGMCAMVLTLLLYPVYSMLLKTTVQSHPELLWYFPPYWFTGLYDLLSPRPDPLFASLGRFALQALGVAIAVFCVAWTFGFRRHHRRTLESDIDETPADRREILGGFLGSPEERAIFTFSGKTLARSRPHRLFLATYLSVGISLGLLVTIVVRAGKIEVSQDGLRSLPLLVTFFVISGFRAGFQFPADLASNWLFQITEARWGEISRCAVRKRVITSGLIPAMLLLLPFEVVFWGWRAGLFHVVFQLAAGALLIEILFWTFNKVPFTCSYFPGKVNLALLAGVYLYGFTSYSFWMADLEVALEHKLLRMLLYFAIAGITLVFFWRRHPAASHVSFDAGVPEIQTLDLT